MPVDKQKILRFKILNDCFRNRHRKYSMDDLVRVCSEVMMKTYDDPKGVSKRTIQNDIAELQMPPYSICLDESLREGHKRIYRYKDVNYSIPLYDISDEERDKLQGAINVLERFEGTPQYDWVRLCLKQVAGDVFMNENRSIISFQNNPDLYGIEHFNTLMDAIANKYPLKLLYKQYPQNIDGVFCDIPELNLTIHPYHLKQYNDRWFLIAKADGKERMGIYALDRIRSLSPLHKKYVEADIDFDEYFDNAVGVTIKGDVTEVLLKVTKGRYPYIKTKPLHWSQTEMRELESSTHVFIRLKVCLNNELNALLLSYGSDVEILQPALLRDEIASIISKMNYFYKQ